MVNGRVRNIRTGFTNNRKSARTTATITAVPNDATVMPGRISAKTITANAVSNNLKMSFIVNYICTQDSKLNKINNFHPQMLYRDW